ncbi:hypothetical protein V2G26_010841 [Clonostachys chloroleuca]|uniref:NmrA-like domain-containing protein n=1 Tax=Clonostachys chloroleuca TaxID=1926264 RepID=A0AA35PUD7_9HYPO|nr:unnamed protein product [Clonostachys chloroleuca]
MSSDNIRNVAVAGASGIIGSKLVPLLIESGRFTVTILGRAGFTDVPAGAKLVVVDYHDQESLFRGLRGQDAIISTLSREATLLQIPLIDAAVRAGVKRFIPSEFGGNLKDSNLRQLPNYANKAKVENHLEKLSSAHGITYTYIYNNVLLDWSIEKGVLLNFQDATVHLYDGGHRAVSMTRVAAAAKAAVQVLLHADETRNKAVRIHEIVISQSQLLAYAKEVDATRIWQEQHVDMTELETKLKAEHTSDVPNLGLFHAYAVKGAFGDGIDNQFQEADNELLGVEPLSIDDLKGMLAQIADNVK